MKTDDQRNCRAACVITDAEGYTSVAEGMEPGRLVEFVNRYFRALFGAIFSNGGVVLDVKGDGILAVWANDAHDRTVRARVCRACLQMVEAAERFNAAFPESGLPTRIGVDFGPIALANVGALARYEYRAIGDPVNTCSRLQELNKELGTRILVSQALAEGIDAFLFRDLGNFMLRGKRSQLRVLELVGNRGNAARQQTDLCRRFDIALCALEHGRIEEALWRFGELCRRFPGDTASRVFVRRCLEWRRQPQPARQAACATSPVGYALN